MAGHGALCYQIRQAFPHGEVTAEEANRIGYETAMRWTKGKYQFFVCTHIDKEHIHNHIYYNSTAYDRSRKFRNFIGSSFSLRRLSDRICLEHDLSVPISELCLLRLLLTSHSSLLLRQMRPSVRPHGISLPVFPRLLA